MAIATSGGGTDAGRIVVRAYDYAALKREFELEERIRVIQQKVSIISRFVGFVTGRLEARRANLLEWLIILLILWEIVLLLLGAA